MQTGKTYFEDVFLWEKDLFNKVRGAPPLVVSEEMRKTFELAMKLVDEEHQELKDAYEAGDYKAMADGAGDLIWVVCGMMAKIGIDLDAAWEEIRRTNWAKKGGPRRPEDGKLLKPEGWVPPDFSEAVDGRDLVESIK
jgi:predicted HAD superfamily Cof-like phosphohydrolase